MQKKLLLLICLVLALAPVTVSAAPRGELIVSRGSLHTENFDPAELGSLLWYANCNEMLVDLIDENGEGKVGYAPKLAEKVEISKDGLTYDFYLRKGIQWHKGYGEFTAEDIVYTIKNVVLREGSHYPHGHIFNTPAHHGIAESVEAVSKYHFRHKLKEPYRWLLMSYSRDLYIVCKKHFEEAGIEKAIKAPIGTGPWQFVELKPGEHVKYMAVNNHWRKTPEFKDLTIKSIPEDATAVAMLKTGALDIAMVDPSKKKELAAAGLHFKVMEGINSYCLNLGGQYGEGDPNYDPTAPWAWRNKEPLDSDWNQRALNVRKAIAYAINKPAIIEKIFYGEAKPTPIYGWDLDLEVSRPEWKPYPYDPEQAKKLLADAGYPKGFAKPVNYLVFDSAWGPNCEKVIMAAAMDLEAVGIKLERKKIDEMQWIDMWPMGRKTTWGMSMGVGYGVPEPVWQFQYVYLGDAFFNDGAFRHPEFDKLYHEAQIAMTTEDMIRTTRAVGDFVYNNYLGVGICLPNWVIAMSKKTGPAEDWKHVWKSTTISEFEYVTHAKK